LVYKKLEFSTYTDTLPFCGNKHASINDFSIFLLVYQLNMEQYGNKIVVFSSIMFQGEKLLLQSRTSDFKLPILYVGLIYAGCKKKVISYIMVGGAIILSAIISHGT
jgi:hypothetical protein